VQPAEGGALQRICAHEANCAWNELPTELRTDIEAILGPAGATAAVGALARRLARIVSSAAPIRDACAGATRLSAALPMFQRVVEVQTRHWSRFIADFARHLHEFTLELRGPGRRQSVAGLAFDLSDPHNGGRTAVRVAFEHGTTWFYKPRGGAAEVAWARITNALNAAGFQPRLQAAEVVSRADHCWMPEVTQQPCVDWPAVQRFFFRAGALVCLAHMLRAVDLHAGNFVAAGEHPVLIDCETLLHPLVAIPATAPDQPESLLRTGMLRTGACDDGATFLGRATYGHHSVTFEARRVVAAEAGDEVLAGFRAMSEFLERKRQQPAISAAIREAESLTVRVLYRPTALYARVLRDSLAPEIAGSDAARRWLLRSRVEGPCYDELIVASEVDQLAACDIPMFYARASTARAPLTASELQQALETLRCSLAAKPAS
jgi:lantibiotic modifying enzyme